MSDPCPVCADTHTLPTIRPRIASIGGVTYLSPDDHTFFDPCPVCRPMYFEGIQRRLREADPLGHRSQGLADTAKYAALDAHMHAAIAAGRRPF